MRILIVEDEHRIANSIKKGLQQEKYAVDISFDGQEGFDLASSEDYDLIILDLMLPKIDGQTVTKMLREKNNQTPILILTAKNQIEDKVNTLNLGADDYLTKPFSFEELLARIRALVRRPKESLNTTLKINGLSLNTTNYEVKRDNKPLKLSSKEFALLEFLMRNPNRILTKDQIINHVWNYDANILPNTIEVYIRNLRNKIDISKKNQRPLIQTVRGFGYKMGN